MVNGYGPGSGPNIDQTVLLDAGDTLDFAVGYGANGNYYDDTTVAAVNVVPPPVVNLAVGSVGRGLWRAARPPAWQSSSARGTRPCR